MRVLTSNMFAIICRPGGLSNATPAEVGNLFLSKEDTLFAGKESPGRSVSRDSVSPSCSVRTSSLKLQCSHICVHMLQLYL